MTLSGNKAARSATVSKNSMSARRCSSSRAAAGPKAAIAAPRFSQISLSSVVENESSNCPPPCFRPCSAHATSPAYTLGVCLSGLHGGAEIMTFGPVGASCECAARRERHWASSIAGFQTIGQYHDQSVRHGPARSARAQRRHAVTAGRSMSGANSYDRVSWRGLFLPDLRMVMSSGRALGAGAGELSRGRQVAWRRLRPQALAARIQNEPERGRTAERTRAREGRTNPNGCAKPNEPKTKRGGTPNEPKSIRVFNSLVS